MKKVKLFDLLLAQHEKNSQLYSTKIEVETINYRLQNEYIDKDFFSEQSHLWEQKICRNFIDLENYFKDNQQILVSLATEKLSQTVKSLTESMVITKLQEMEFNSIVDNLKEIKETLAKKADKADLYQIEDQKASKLSNEKIVRLVNLIQKQMSALSINNINFMKLFHASYQSYSSQRKNQDIEQVIVQLQSVFKWINSSIIQDNLNSIKDLGGIDSDFSPMHSNQILKQQINSDKQKFNFTMQELNLSKTHSKEFLRHLQTEVSDEVDQKVNQITPTRFIHYNLGNSLREKQLLNRKLRYSANMRGTQKNIHVQSLLNDQDFENKNCSSTKHYKTSENFHKTLRSDQENPLNLILKDDNILTKQLQNSIKLSEIQSMKPQSLSTIIQEQ
eukprot:TRINITY_DN35996_c0_g1_i1.p1 TRINITY_DN35996_c0_g1~~TRINITY_DN35996_c0_g1_i1.p1  ORF type:complete len:390 (+),score=56.13 TRINITY_DN35996_c0_g1_i1:220-1389(+)